MRATTTIPMTNTADGTAHAVLESEIAGNRTGLYRATCGNLVIAGSLCDPHGRRCWACWPHEPSRM
jgi:hypothetical protein